MTLVDQEVTPVVRGVSLKTVSGKRWRVLDRHGRVLGHLRAEKQEGGVRYFAERFELATARLRVLGAFWTASEAVECLRYLR